MVSEGIQMKVLLINGSPHQHGCTDLAMEETISVLHKHGIETELVWLGTRPTPGCIACNTCGKIGRCVFNDDRVNELNARSDEFDAMIVGGPVYYGGICGQLTSFLDRLFYSASGCWTGKPGAAIVSCRRGGNTAAYQRLNMYFGISNMPIVTSQYWNEIHGNNREQAMQDLEGRQTMRTLGENLAYMLKCKKAAEEAGVSEPQYEPQVFTNFIR